MLWFLLNKSIYHIPFVHAWPYQIYSAPAVLIQIRMDMYHSYRKCEYNAKIGQWPIFTSVEIITAYFIHNFLKLLFFNFLVYSGIIIYTWYIWIFTQYISPAFVPGYIPAEGFQRDFNYGFKCVIWTVMSLNLIVVYRRSSLQFQFSEKHNPQWSIKSLIVCPLCRARNYGFCFICRNKNNIKYM